MTLSTGVAFRYASRRANADFECKLDAAAWKRCGSRIAYRGLAAGPHRFLVRAEVQGAGRSRPARFDWVQAEPKSFSIAAELSGLSKLYPGAPPVAVPLVLTNPNSAPVFVTGLRVAVTADPPGCASAENLELIQSNASRKAPLPDSRPAARFACRPKEPRPRRSPCATSRSTRMPARVPSSRSPSRERRTVEAAAPLCASPA